jgi:arginyl-tRNA synthetase
MAQNSIQIRNKIKTQIEVGLRGLLVGYAELENLISKINLGKPSDSTRGDYATSIALIAGKAVGKNPVEIAVSLVDFLHADINNPEAELNKIVEKVEVAGAGFINFYLHENLATEAILEASKKDAIGQYGKIDLNLGKKIAYEYTDPNPFKVFHIGHLMSNMIGESLSRLGEFTNAEIRRFCYQGDIGRHVALFVYGLRFMDEPFPTEQDVADKNMSLTDRMYYMGQSYAKGATYFKEHPEVEEEVQVINKKLYERSDDEINTIYDLGLLWSLEYFETLYVRLGTKFDQYFFESKCVEPARALIKDGLAKGIFTESEGAIVFEGEKFQDESNGEKFHTRVFITKVGLPTYDAKELGLAKLKYEAFNYDNGIVVTANEQDQYFQVNLKAQSLMLPEIAGKNSHVSHGMMVLPTGKMSSRTGDVVSGEEMLESARTTVLEIMKDRDMSADEKEKISDQIAIAGLKYLVLRQAPGKNVIYDAKKALSFEGDSGPYLQYATVRAKTVIEKAKAQGIEAIVMDVPANQDLKNILQNETALELSKKIFIFHDTIEHAYLESAPNIVATYLIELASLFNNFYANNKIIDTTDEATKSKSAEFVTLTQAVARVLENGLYLLGIGIPNKM